MCYVETPGLKHLTKGRVYLGLQFQRDEIDHSGKKQKELVTRTLVKLEAINTGTKIPQL